jgi:glutamyl-tRNA synthetase
MSPENVVTRFAPSPTGYLHIGGARTALFNWLLARKMKGKFILRMEDTDIKRNTEAAARQVIKDLKWLGIDWDEGPEANGPNSPYFQSQRRDIYDKYIKQLLDENKAYYCFDTPEELDKLREQAIAQKKTFTYPRPEKFPDAGDVEKAKADGRPVVVRFAMPKGPKRVEDEVRGAVMFSGETIGDFIIQKSDGFPTYHLAVVVDDQLMGVTHVIRGQEHLMNTPGHTALQKALDFTEPIYAHMSVTVSETGGKLSKRERPNVLREIINKKQDLKLDELASVGGMSAEQLDSFLKGDTTPDISGIDAMAEHLEISLPEINVVDFFKSGYLPEALVNFIALLGFNPGDDREIMLIEDLIESFSLQRLTKTNSLFDRKKLIAFNTDYIRMTTDEKLLEHFKDFLEAINSPLTCLDDEKLTKILKVNTGVRTLAEIETKSRFLILPNDRIEYDSKAVQNVLLKNDGLTILATIREKLSEMTPFTEDNIEKMLRLLADEKLLGLGKVAQPLRVAICGTTISPSIFESVALLGKESTLARIDNTLNKFKSKT